ncbi:P-loop containing nucleoside triphosphate hydrolase protein [Hypoxylon argillaceum]|nr:P-loop containing nucleoside triphosphate hydrolase protein [Hypoxylon argillaceum]
MRFLFSSSRLARTSLAPRSLSRYAFSTSSSASREKAKRKHVPMTPSSMAERTLHAMSNVRPATADRRAMERTLSIFCKLAVARFDDLLSMEPWSLKQSEYRAFGVNSSLDFDRETKLYRKLIVSACDLAIQKNLTSQKDNRFFWALRNSFVTQDVKGLSIEIKYGFQSFLMRSRFPNNILDTHRKIADMRYPYEWYPATRALQRTIYLHVGPTNSGKTYHALKALEAAKSGIYAGPLRLLAHEVYTRFIAKGRSCALITGEEQRIPKDVDTYFSSCTVEMAPLNRPVEVAVVDEIQMIGDVERGWAWSQALLGIQAKELHLCGEERAVELVQSLCAMLGDKCVVKRYQRLSGLETMHESLNGQLQNLEKGDAVVSFTRVGIHALKKQIEEATGKRAAVVYGSLPPETRAQQAALFNDPNNDYDYLVASDAIGMGLNLEIRRVVFEATHKRDSSSFRQMSISELKQIGGRAGRFRTANHAIQAGTSDGTPSEPKPSGPGLVTALEDVDLANVIKAFDSEPEPIKTAGIQPPTSAIERLSTYFPPNTPLSFILVRLRDIAMLSPKFHLCNLKEMLDISDLIQPFRMSIYDRCVFLNAPVALRDRDGDKILQVFARAVSRMEGGELLDIPELPLELLDINAEHWKPGGQAEYLRKLEALHKSITLYLWLSYRFTGIFTSQNLAFHVKELVEVKINDYLAGVSETSRSRRKRMEAARKLAKAKERRKGELLGDFSQEDEEPQPQEWNKERPEEPLYDNRDQLAGDTGLGQEPGGRARL